MNRIGSAWLIDIITFAGDACVAPTVGKPYPYWAQPCTSTCGRGRPCFRNAAIPAARRCWLEAGAANPASGTTPLREPQVAPLPRYLSGATSGSPTSPSCLHPLEPAPLNLEPIFLSLSSAGRPSLFQHGPDYRRTSAHWPGGRTPQRRSIANTARRSLHSVDHVKAFPQSKFELHR